MKIRTYLGTDFREILNLWNQALLQDPISRELLIRKLLLDPNFRQEGFFVAEENGTILGFANAVYRLVPASAGGGYDDETGWISAFAISPEQSAKKVGNALIDAVEDYLTKRGKHKIDTKYAPLYFTQGIAEIVNSEYIKLFTDRGYEGCRSTAMDLDLTTYTKSDKVEKKRAELIEQGFYIGALTDEYIVQYIDENRPGSNVFWSAEYRTRLLSNLDFESVRIAAKDQMIVGSCVFGDPNSSPERFGPFGVNSEFQGKGIGTVLLSDCLFEMKKRNLHCAWMQWPSKGGAAGSLYKSVGFKETKSYISFSKEL